VDTNKIIKQITSVTSSEDLEKIRIELLGRQGIINQEFSKIKTAPDPKQFGADLNIFKKQVEELILEKAKTVSSKISRHKSGSASGGEILNSQLGLPKLGHLHPITQTERALNELFKSLGFSIYDGPVIETDEYNFERLNVPKNHPARDMQDSIFIREPESLLRTQTSAIEARLLASERPPFKVAFPGTVYRNEKVNKSNHFVFHQYQAVVVDHNITMRDLIGTMDLMFKTLYGPNVVVRYRCKYYPEVEPGVGPDMQCFNCHGTGCGVCKGAGWIEMGGSGMIHPNVLSRAGIDPKTWRGFAFGMGLDRWTMAKYNITDIRTLLGGNLAYKPNSL
jgi:phenylalanyl-tRNA synthetase alpha chain